jgi:hypothetical protein
VAFVAQLRLGLRRPDIPVLATSSYRAVRTATRPC